MEVILVRHGCAGIKAEWAGPDSERPLDAAGWAQSRALTDSLQDRQLARICSSPTLRCVQTVEALAYETGLAVEELDELGPQASARSLLDMLTDPELADAVLCTHGELLEDVLSALRDAGTPISADPVVSLLQKGSAWVLEVAPGRGGSVRSLRHLVPSNIHECAHH